MSLNMKSAQKAKRASTKPLKVGHFIIESMHSEEEENLFLLSPVFVNKKRKRNQVEDPEETPITKKHNYNLRSSAKSALVCELIGKRDPAAKKKPAESPAAKKRRVSSFIKEQVKAEGVIPNLKKKGRSAQNKKQQQLRVRFMLQDGL